MAKKKGKELNKVEAVPIEEPQSNNALVFGTTVPAKIIKSATNVAKQVSDIVKKAKLFSLIKGKKYVKAEGWTSMIAMLGVFPETEYCKKIDREDEVIYEARIILKHVSGNTVGAGEAICSSKEKNWKNRDEYAIKSMAQTRAVGKACRLSFSWIMALSGYEATPAEEIPREENGFVDTMKKVDVSNLETVTVEDDL